MLTHRGFVFCAAALRLYSPTTESPDRVFTWRATGGHASKHTLTPKISTNAHMKRQKKKKKQTNKHTHPRKTGWV